MTNTFPPNVFVRQDGCVRLGDGVTCDGFMPGVPIRVQTHVHEDHLTDFDRSKGAQDKIVCSEGTYSLLVAERNADLPYRQRQFISLPLDGTSHKLEGFNIQLHPSGHMIGGAMATVTQPNGFRFTYSSDFSWPLATFPTDIDVLVVDATYGNPQFIRGYDESAVIERLQELAFERWHEGSLAISGHRGRLQFAAGFLSSCLPGPFLFSDSFDRTRTVYANHAGYELQGHRIKSTEGRRIIESGDKYIAFVESRDRIETNIVRANSRFLLSAYMVPPEDPVLIHSSGLIRVALTDHADFRGTIDLIAAIRPKMLIADNSRGGQAEVLAKYVESELGIPSKSDFRPTEREWGA